MKGKGKEHKRGEGRERRGNKVEGAMMGGGLEEVTQLEIREHDDRH